MPRVKPHHHPCADCGTKTECPGTWEENYDGEPAVICDEVDRRGYEPLCEDCYAKRETLSESDSQRGTILENSDTPDPARSTPIDGAYVEAK